MSVKYQTFNCKKEYVSACDILVGIHSSDAEPGLEKKKEDQSRSALHVDQNRPPLLLIRS